MATTREQLIETTCTLLELQGYHATGINQIIAESATPKGSLYYHFPGGKDELTAEALERVGAIVLKRIRENLAAEPDTAEAIQGFMHNIALNIEASGYQAGGPITTVALETASSSEHLREVCQGIYSAWQGAVKARLLDGGFAEAQAERLAALIIAAIEGSIILCRTQRSGDPMRHAADEIAMYIRSLV